MGWFFGNSNTSTDISEIYETYEAYESNVDFILINSLGNILIIIILIIIIIAALIILYNYIKNLRKGKKYENERIKDNKIYTNINNDYNIDNNNYYNRYSGQNQRNQRYQKKRVEMRQINTNYNNYNNNYSAINDNKNNIFLGKNNKQNFTNNKFKNYNNYSLNNNIMNNKISNNNNKNNNIIINNKFKENSIENNFNNNNFNNNNIINNNFNNNNIINNNFNFNSSNADIRLGNNINNNLNSIINNDSPNILLENIGYISSNIQEEPQIGLANIGATCYMNATLQCLSHTINLSNYFLNKKNEKLIKSKQLSKGYLEVIKRLWLKSYNKNKTYYEPHEFKKLISDMNPLFQGIAANDSKDLVNFIIQQLHEELNKANLNQVNNTFEINQYDEKQMFLSFFEEFKNNQKSIISDNFYFFIETKTECLNCKQINQMRGNNNPIYLYNFQIMHFLIFPLEEVRKYKIMQYQQNFNEVNLIDCFVYNQKIDIMQGENQMWCRGCRQNAPSQYMTLLYSGPKYLILILNRGKGNIFNVKLNFTEILDIGNFVTMKQSNNLIYHLYAIVTHLGPSSMGGHFIAFCKSPIDNQWYKYNDAIVECVGNFYNDIHNFGVPYILFYESQNQ